ncbi:MAG: type VI secretion system protein TssA, partial [Acidobacteria bacterium]|nr:type VI secretion system protein TssA [Acidobacteriota bacterium]
MAAEWSEALALPDLEKLLAPISAERPAGDSLRYDPLYDEVREARREDDPNLPQGVWKVEPKKADWPRVESLSLEALERRSKDLQIASWLTEAWVHRCGFEGAEHGLRLLSGLCESFWEPLHPVPGEDGDLEPRLGPFDWLDQRISLAVKSVPVTRPETEEGEAFCWSAWESALHKAKVERVRSGAELEGQADTSKFMVSTSLTS